MRLKPLAEQVMVVTGASSGIGLVTARRAVARGASVMLVAREEDALRAIVQDLQADGGQAAYAVADVGDADDVRRAAAKTVKHFGRIDTWVNNAGVAIYAKLADTPMAEHEKLFRTNYFGAVHGALTAIEHLREAGGALITVGSIAGDIPSPIMGAYSASKHAIKGFIHSLRIEVIADGLPISVTLVKPSGIDTPIAQHAANHVGGEALIPIPVYDPDLVADAVLRAAERPCRDITVGGGGKLQTLLVEHFPFVLDRVGRWFEPMLSDPGRPKTRSDNLAGPAKDGVERSHVQSGRSFSTLSVVNRHKAAFALGLGGLGLLLFARTRRD